MQSKLIKISTLKKINQGRSLVDSTHFRYYFSINNDKPTKYILSQFPYPSGDLHLGHARVYLIGDTLTKYYQMKNYNVLYPMGWDSFGLPAQNAAIVNKQNPKIWTENNIQKMKNQLNQLKIPFPWQRQISTCDPQYYKWTQWIFIKMFKLGLAYKAEASVNWDPVDKTVLANQQVDQNGFSWRSGAKVQKRVLSQWFLKIKEFAQDLDKQLTSPKGNINIKSKITSNEKQQCKDLQKWVNVVKDMQKGWIGFKKGYFIQGLFKNNNNQSQIKVEIFMDNQFIEDMKNKKSLKENNLYIYLNQQVPSNNEIIGQIRFSSINKFIKVKAVRQQAKQQGILSFAFEKQQKVQNHFGQQFFNKLPKRQGHTMRLKDWLISRQRYWGTPIPIIYCKICGTLPVPQQNLPIILPQWPSKQHIQANTNPLIQENFKKCKCPKCGDQAERQSDTMDTFVDSSWYFLRFLDPKNKNQIVNAQKVKNQMPVNIYIGGMQHAIMHLLYARFIYRVLQRYGLTSGHTQPFQQLIAQGLIKGKTYKLKSNHAYIKRNEIEKYQKEELIESYEKMSKSKFNGVSPGQILEKYSVDQLRIAILFAGPPQNDIDFHQELLLNSRRFLTRVQQIYDYLQSNYNKIRTQKQQILINKSCLTKNQQFLNTANNLFDRLQLSMQKRALHTYVANIMELTNSIRKVILPNEEIQQTKLSIEKLEEYFSLLWTLLIVSYPICPIFSQKLQTDILQLNGLSSNIDKQVWPVIQRQYLQVLIKKGNKMIRKQYVSIQIYNEQQHNKELKKQLGLTNEEVINIKKLKKNVIIVIK